MAKATETDEITIESSEISDDNDAVMQSVLSEFDKTEENVTLQIKVYRVAGGQNAKGQRERFLFYADPSEFPILERVRDEYGSGIYRVRIYKTVGNRTGLVRAFDFDIEAPDKQTTPVKTQSDMGMVLAAIEKSNQTVVSLMERLIERQREPERQTIDPMGMVERTVALAASLAGIKGSQSNGPSVDGMLSLISKGIEIGQKASGGGEGGSEPKGIIDLIMAAINSPLAERVMSALPTQPAPQSRQQPITSQSIPIHGPKPGESSEPAPQNVPLNVQMLTQAIVALDGQRRAGVDIGQVAPWLAAQVPPAMLDGLLQDPMALDKLSQGFPIVRDNRGWFTALFNELRRMDSEGFDDGSGFDPDSGGGAGDSGDAQGHEATGP